MKKSLLLLSTLALTPSQIFANNITAINKTPYKLKLYIPGNQYPTSLSAVKDPQKINTKSDKIKFHWDVEETGGSYQTTKEYTLPAEINITNEGKKYSIVKTDKKNHYADLDITAKELKKSSKDIAAKTAAKDKNQTINDNINEKEKEINSQEAEITRLNKRLKDKKTKATTKDIQDTEDAIKTINKKITSLKKEIKDLKAQLSK